MRQKTLYTTALVSLTLLVGGTFLADLASSATEVSGPRTRAVVEAELQTALQSQDEAVRAKIGPLKLEMRNLPLSTGPAPSQPSPTLPAPSLRTRAVVEAELQTALASQDETVRAKIGPLKTELRNLPPSTSPAPIQPPVSPAPSQPSASPAAMAMPSDQVFMSSLPVVLEFVTHKKKEACDQVANMKRIYERQEKAEYPISERMEKNKVAWEQLCDRRTDVERTLKGGDQNLILQTMKRIYADPDVKKIVDQFEQAFGTPKKVTSSFGW